LVYQRLSLIWFGFLGVAFHFYGELGCSRIRFIHHGIRGLFFLFKTFSIFFFMLCASGNTLYRVGVLLSFLEGFER